MKGQYSVIHFAKEIGDRHTMLIEIQANIQHSIEKKFNFMFLGKLSQISEDSYMLNIGNHQIIGKKIKLKNPFLLCHKCKKEENIVDNKDKITILQIIEYKILFNSRPTPLLMGKGMGKKIN